MLISIVCMRNHIKTGKIYINFGKRNPQYLSFSKIASDTKCKINLIKYNNINSRSLY